MYWKYILVNFLLVVPNSRIFTLAAVENAPEFVGPLNSELSEEDLVDKLIEELTYVQQQENIPSNNIDKKDKAVAQKGNSNNGDTNLELPATEPVPDAEKAGVNFATSSNSRADVPPEHDHRHLSQGVSHAVPGEASPLQQQIGEEDSKSRQSRVIDQDDRIFIIIIAVAVSTGFVGLMLAGVCYYKFRKSAKASSDVEYPAYGVTGPIKEKVPSPGDRKLAQSAQMYHYQHQKQQMIAMEKANGEMKHDASEDDSEEDNVEGDYTVYECPGLAPTGEMEVRNPLFRGEETPVTPGQDITGQPHEQEPSTERGNQ